MDKTFKPERWTGILVGKMHNERVSLQDMADEMGVSRSYVSQVLNGKKTPSGCRDRLEFAFESILEKRGDSDDC